MQKTQARYEYFGPNGIQWTKWFDYDGDTSKEYQYKHGSTVLRNEYRTIEV